MRNEAALLSFEEALAAKERLVLLLNRVMVIGFPAHTRPHKNWRDAERSQTFAEVTLLASLNCVVRRIGKENQNDAQLTIDIDGLRRLIRAADNVTLNCCLDYINLSGEHISVISIYGASLIGNKAVHSYIQHTNIVNSYIHKADFTGALLVASILRSSLISNSNFTKANLTGTFLEGVKVVDTDFEKAKLFHARLHDADMSGAKNLTQEQINVAFGNSKTVLPDGLHHPNHWDDESDLRGI